MYNQIFQLRELGFSKSKIAKKSGIVRGTIIDYLDKDPEDGFLATFYEAKN